MTTAEKTTLNEATFITQPTITTSTSSDTKSITSLLSSSVPVLSSPSEEIFTVIETASIPLTPSAEPTITNDQTFSSNTKTMIGVGAGLFLLVVFGIVIYKVQHHFKKRRRNAIEMAEEGTFISPPSTITPTSPRYAQREEVREQIRQSDVQVLRRRIS
jgi:hypothetical protein